MLKINRITLIQHYECHHRLTGRRCVTGEFEPVAPGCKYQMESITDQNDASNIKQYVMEAIMSWLCMS